MNEEQKKFGEAEIILGVFYFGAVDAIAILIDLTGVGLVIAPFLQALFGTGVMLFWFWAKGNKGALRLGKVALKFAANALPIVPTNLIIFAVSAYFHNHPEKAGLMQKLTGKKGGSLAGAAPGGKN